MGFEVTTEIVDELTSTDEQILKAAHESLPSKWNRLAPFFEFNADNLVHRRNVNFTMRSLLVQNMSNVAFIISFDSGAHLTVQQGAIITLLPPGGAHLIAQSVVIGTGTMVCVPFEEPGDLDYGGQNDAPAAVVAFEHVFNGTATNTASMAVPARTSRVSVTIVNEGTTAIRAGNTADAISPTVGEYISPNGGSANFIGSEQIDVASTGGNSAYSGVDAYNQT